MSTHHPPSSGVPTAPAPNVASVIRDPALEAGLRHAGAVAFLDLPLPQLPPSPGVGIDRPPAPNLHDLLTGVPGTDAAHAGPLGHLPQLPADPVGALMHGLHIPALPGAHEAMAPVLSLLRSVGTGTFDKVDPAQAFRASSQVLETAMQLGTGALGSLMTVWQGTAARAAQASGQRAADHGSRTSAQGMTIADITNRASASVNKGYTMLTAIASDFAGKIVALGPMLLTPPGQMALMQLVTTHLAEGGAVVARTQADLGALGAEIGAAGGLLGILENSGIDLPSMANQALQSAQPAVSQISNTLGRAGGGLGSPDELGGLGAESVSDDRDLTDPAPYTGAASFGGGGGGVADTGVGDDGPGDAGDDSASPGPSALPGLGGSAAPRQPTDDRPVTPVAPGTGTAGTMPMSTGIPAMGSAMRGEGPRDHSRSVATAQGHGRRAVDGLDPVPPAVVGAEDPDEDARYERRYGYHDSGRQG